MTDRTLATSLLLTVAVAASPATAAEHVITQQGKAFSQTEITIAPGDTLVFKNEDPVNHSVFSDTKGMEFNVRAQAPGTSTPVTLATEGTAEVKCAFHPTMKLRVLVKK